MSEQKPHGHEGPVKHKEHGQKENAHEELKHVEQEIKVLERKEHEHSIYIFFVDGKKYETDKATITGAGIKALVPGFPRQDSLFLEGKGKEEDKLIGDDTSVDLADSVKHFYSVPPASFGK